MNKKMGEELIATRKSFGEALLENYYIFIFST